MKKFRKILDNLKEKPLVAFFDIFLFRIVDHKVSMSAASLTYFLILSIFPFLIALLNIVQFFDQNLLKNLMEAFALLPKDIYKVLVHFLEEVRKGSSLALLSISLLASVYSASSGVKQVIKSINEAYYTRRKRSLLAQMALSLIMTIALFFLIILIFFLQVIGTTFLNQIFEFFNIQDSMQSILALLMNLVPLVFMFISFWALYRFSPALPQGKKLSKKSLLISSGFASLGIVIATMAFKAYVANFSSYTRTYGSLAGIIIFLVWLYLFGYIILLGGEITASLYELEERGSQWPRDNSILGKFIEK